MFKYLLILSILLFNFKIKSFDQIDYSLFLKSAEQDIEIEKNDLRKISEISDAFIANSNEFAEKLVEKFKHKKNFVGSDVYNLKSTLVVNQKITSALIMLVITGANKQNKDAARIILFHHSQNFFDSFYHSKIRLRQMLKAALKSIVSEEGENKWRKNMNFLIDASMDSNYFSRIKNLSYLEHEFDEYFIQVLKSKIIKRLKLNFSNHEMIDSFYGIINGSMGYVNSVLATTVGSMKLRNGHLYHNQSGLKELKKDLQPLDILMTSSPFLVGGMAIPGHFDHGAIYLGTKSELMEIGMWNHPSIIPFQNQILQGKVILDNTINGVLLNSIEEFLNADELLVMRRDDTLNDLSILEKQFKIGMEQIGKKYNHTYDVLKLNKILFTELIYLIYFNDEFPTRERLGHLTIYPSDIIEVLFQENAAFKMIKNFRSDRKGNLEQLSFDTLKKRTYKLY